jgi:hypothetical protein
MPTVLVGYGFVGTNKCALTMAHLCGGSKLEREGSTKESKYHAKRAKNVHERI